METQKAQKISTVTVKKMENDDKESQKSNANRGGEAISGTENLAQA